MLITDWIKVSYVHYGTWLDNQTVLRQDSLREG